MNRGVLLLGAEPRIVAPIARCLSHHHVGVTVAGISERDIDPRCRAVDHFSVLPSLADEEFLPCLRELIQTRGIELIMAVGDSGLTALAEHDLELRKHARLCSPAAASVIQVLDKDKTLAAAQHCGIPIPATYHFPTCAGFQKALPTLSFPMIGKARSKGLVRGFKICRFDSREELAKAFAADPETCTHSIFQEYCPGEGVGLEILMHQGEPLAIVQHRRLKELPAAGGVSVLAVTEEVDPKLRAWSLQLLRQVGWQGVAMVEFRHDRRSGRTVLMEVNGRYWGSIALSLFAGCAFPWYDWQLAHGDTPQIPSRFRAGVRARWTSGYIFRARDLFLGSAKGRLRALAREALLLLSAFRPGTRDMVFSMADPMPALAEAKRASVELMSAAAKVWLRKLAPEILARELYRVRALHPSLQRKYLGRQWKRWLGGYRPDWQARLAHARGILFVCYGNIIRSPMAAALLRQELSNRGTYPPSIESAGLRNQVEEAADGRAIEVAREFGISLQEHKPQRLTAELVQQADLIFVMDWINEAMLLEQWPSAQGKIFLLGALGRGPADPLEIDDPYAGEMDEIRQCYGRIRAAVEELAKALGGIAAVSTATLAH